MATARNHYYVKTSNGLVSKCGWKTIGNGKRAVPQSAGWRRGREKCFKCLQALSKPKAALPHGWVVAGDVVDYEREARAYHSGDARPLVLLRLRKQRHVSLDRAFVAALVRCETRMDEQFWGLHPEEDPRMAWMRRVL